MTAEILVFIILAAIAIASALGMLLSRNTVYAALFLVLNFVTIALFYLQLTGPFISLAQVAVYAGAIMVLFLFVIMLLGIERLPDVERTPWQRPLSIILAVILVGIGAYVLLTGGVSGGEMEATATTAEVFGTPRAIAETLFLKYAFPVVVIGVILLVAMVGVIVMTKNYKETKRVIERPVTPTGPSA